MDFLCSVYDTNDNRSIDMTDKVKQVIWVFNSEKNKKQRIQLRTLLDRVNGTYKQRYLNKSVKYFALEKDRDEFAKDCRS
jgi:hypothetical protein